MENINSFSEIACTSEIREEFMGYVYMMSPVTRTHAKLCRRLSNLLEDKLKTKWCEVVDEGVAFNIPKELWKDRSRKEYYVTDTALVCKPSWSGAFCETKPCVVFEVLSTSSLREIERDRFVKKQLYAKLGVPEYIIVTQDGTVEVNRIIEPGIYKSSTYLIGNREGVIFRSEYITEIELTLEEIYQDILYNN